METACGVAQDNPAAHLASWITDAHRCGRDKLTLVCSEGLEPFGLWAEQLVAESLGRTAWVSCLSSSTIAGRHPATGMTARSSCCALRTTLAYQPSRASRRGPPVFEAVSGRFSRSGRGVRALGVRGRARRIPARREPVRRTERHRSQAGGRMRSSRAVTSRCRPHTRRGRYVITFGGGLSAPEEPVATRADALRLATQSAAPGDYVAFLVYALMMRRGSRLCATPARVSRGTPAMQCVWNSAPATSIRPVSSTRVARTPACS